MRNVQAHQSAWDVCMAQTLAPLGTQNDDHADSSVMLALSCIQTDKQVKFHRYQSVLVMLGTWGEAGT